ncbi:MAG TPA: high potential iron sulfur protein [Roseiarcus sp.]|nr:high potential iron sulfur protein [Roseiarcus sp.]
MTNARLFHAEASRRVLLRAVARSVAALAIASYADDAIARKGKRSQSEVAYQDTPKGNERCEICTAFLPPDQCRTVVGPVGRQGWCNIYEGPD